MTPSEFDKLGSHLIGLAFKGLKRVIVLSIGLTTLIFLMAQCFENPASKYSGIARESVVQFMKKKYGALSAIEILDQSYLKEAASQWGTLQYGLTFIENPASNREVVVKQIHFFDSKGIHKHVDIERMPYSTYVKGSYWNNLYAVENLDSMGPDGLLRTDSHQRILEE